MASACMSAMQCSAGVRPGFGGRPGNASLPERLSSGGQSLSGQQLRRRGLHTGPRPRALRARLATSRAELLEADAEGAKGLVEEGYQVVDVRDSTQYERSRIKGSVHIPLFIVNEDTDLNTAIKRQAHQNFSGLLYGLAFTKPNPDFFRDVQKAFPSKDAKILFVCQEGLRSSTAADDVEDLGYTNLAILGKGLNRVQPGLFEKEGPRELKDAGKGGFVAIQTQFSIVLATILISCLLFIQFFPDQAEQLLGGL